MRWQNWDAKDATQRNDAERIHDSYSIMQEMVVLAYKEAEAQSTTFKRWFGTKNADDVKKVLARIVDMSPPTGPEMAPRMKDRVLRQDDYAKPPLCKTITSGPWAYTDAPNGKFHLCQRGIKDRDLSKLTCDNLDKPRRGKKDDRMSSEKISSVAGTMMHEAVYVPTLLPVCNAANALLNAIAIADISPYCRHWNDIGNAVLGKQIEDHSYGAYKCSVLSDAQKLSK